MPLKRYFTEWKPDYDKNDNSNRCSRDHLCAHNRYSHFISCAFPLMHKNQLSKLSVQIIAQQRDLLALPGPVLATLIKRTRAELLITQRCYVN
ncbi:hypothetical protein T11_11777 [Trichinella zimbabwensis]|uniref:Uncharacterized protein n=1 Tax=Trichinella zimbabwensis TaxID=268475 RepID=A0A0V1GJB6_9BILA|nr:hypothetical protein T11_11777 [Trichinella zimbabwensis]